MTASTRLYLVRHCEVANPEGIIYGHLPGFYLSEAGIAQARALGRFFRTTAARRIYCSPLERARQTASLIAETNPGMEIIAASELTESGLARYLQGIPRQHMRWRRPLWWVHHYFPGLLSFSETDAAMAARLARPLQRLLEAFPEHGGICISHRDPIVGFLKHHGAWGLEVPTGGVLVLDYEAGALTGMTLVEPRGHRAWIAPPGESHRDFNVPGANVGAAGGLLHGDMDAEPCELEQKAPRVRLEK